MEQWPLLELLQLTECLLLADEFASLDFSHRFEKLSLALLIEVEALLLVIDDVRKGRVFSSSA